MPKGRYDALHGIPNFLEEAEYGLLPLLARQSESASKLMTIPGVGPITITALVASIPIPDSFAMADNWQLGWA